jgi:pimeloyl-ACP methyl ester carboxylesterase
VPFAELGDVRLFYTDEGLGDPPILFVHGFSCDSHDWTWQLPHFVADHRVLAVDIRGHGRSSAPSDGYDPIQFAADLAALIDQLGVPPVVAIGHSLGGVIVSALAVEHPDRVQAVVSVDPGYLVPDEAGELLAGMVALTGSDPVQAFDMLLGSTYGPGSSPALTMWHRRRVAGMSPEVLSKTLGSLMRTPDGMAFLSVSEPYLRRRSCPVLAFYADPGRAAIEASLFEEKKSKVVSWEGAGHWLHQERPAEFNAIVESWLATLA